MTRVGQEEEVWLITTQKSVYRDFIKWLSQTNLGLSSKMKVYGDGIMLVLS